MGGGEVGVWKYWCVVSGLVGVRLGEVGDEREPRLVEMSEEHGSILLEEL